MYLAVLTLASAFVSTGATTNTASSILAMSLKVTITVLLSLPTSTFSTVFPVKENTSVVTASLLISVANLTSTSLEFKTFTDSTLASSFVRTACQF